MRVTVYGTRRICVSRTMRVVVTIRSVTHCPPSTNMRPGASVAWPFRPATFVPGATTPHPLAPAVTPAVPPSTQHPRTTRVVVTGTCRRTTSFTHRVVVTGTRSTTFSRTVRVTVTGTFLV